MKLDVLNKKNEKVGDISVSDVLFGAVWKSDLVHQVVVSQLSNKRKPWAHTKDRREVSGGGRKPWRQKGTGRARHGSIRSPLWIGGGVALGPRNERSYEKKINKKMERAAIFSILSKKLADGEIRIIDNFGVSEKKTKAFKDFFKDIFSDLKNKSVLVVTGEKDRNLFIAGRNLPKVMVVDAKNLNPYELLSHNYILFDKEAIAGIKSNFKVE